MRFPAEIEGEAAHLELTCATNGPPPPTVRAVEGKENLTAIGRFRLVQLIGEGGLGQVFRAEDITDGTTAAVKILHPHLASRPTVRKRFLKEARLLSEVKSPYVANILEINEDHGTYYLALEFIAGHSLGDVLREPSLCPDGRLAEAQVKWEAAHGRPLVAG